MSAYIALFLSLPSRAASGRMRIWRALKALGAATLRDGVYLLPETPAHHNALAGVAALADADGGSAELLRLAALEPAQEEALRQRFDRSADYAVLIAETGVLRQALPGLDEEAAAKRSRALLQKFAQLETIDHFPGPARQQAADALDDLRAAAWRRYSPDEPQAIAAELTRLDPAAYRGRIWATRARPWIDRLASAWLIRRCIDPEARIAWLASPADCRPDWLGFDFDGARFSHVGSRVTFEVLAASFGLDADPALLRLGALVHQLDVGGAPVAEAAGIAAVLGGLRNTLGDDDALLDQAGRLFDGLYDHYRRESADA